MGLILPCPLEFGFLAAAILGHWDWAVLLLGWAVVNRLTEAFSVGWVVLRDAALLRKIWLYPRGDLLGFIVWCASFAGTKIAWRGSQIELQGEKMVLRKIPGVHPQRVIRKADAR